MLRSRPYTHHIHTPTSSSAPPQCRQSPLPTLLASSDRDHSHHPIRQQSNAAIQPPTISTIPSASTCIVVIHEASPPSPSSSLMNQHSSSELYNYILIVSVLPLSGSSPSPSSTAFNVATPQIHRRLPPRLSYSVPQHSGRSELPKVSLRVSPSKPS